MITCSIKIFSIFMLKIWNTCACAFCDYSFTHTIGKYLGIWYQLETASRIPLDKSGHKRWRHKCGHVTFRGTSYNVCNFLVEISILKQAIKLSFGRNKFGKRAVQIYKPDNIFRESHVIKLIKWFATSIYQKVPPLKLTNSYHVRKRVHSM